MIQLLIHLWGDYILQSDWMAQNKTKAHFPAAVHAIVYSLGFLLLKPSVTAFAVILVTHFLIDRYRLARYVVWAKNWLYPPTRYYEPLNDQFGIGGKNAWLSLNPPFAQCATTGYPPGRPEWMAVWLLIIADNILHLTINAAALRWL
jgi:hypothetical protein